MVIRNKIIHEFVLDKQSNTNKKSWITTCSVLYQCFVTVWLITHRIYSWDPSGYPSSLFIVCSRSLSEAWKGSVIMFIMKRDVEGIHNRLILRKIECSHCFPLYHVRESLSFINTCTLSFMIKLWKKTKGAIIHRRKPLFKQHSKEETRRQSWWCCDIDSQVKRANRKCTTRGLLERMEVIHASLPSSQS